MFYTLFNVYVVGTIFDIGFWNFELIRRVFDPMLSFWCFIFSFVLVHRKEMQYSVFDNLLLLMIPTSFLCDSMPIAILAYAMAVLDNRKFKSFIRDYLSYLLERGYNALFPAHRFSKPKTHPIPWNRHSFTDSPQRFLNDILGLFRFTFPTPAKLPYKSGLRLTCII